MELQIGLNGNLIQGLLYASIVTSNCFSSDSYALTFAMGPSPLGDIAFWSTLSSAYIAVNVITSEEPTSRSLITGMIDTILVDPIQGTVSVEGRDLSSSMIDSYRQQDFVNQTASEVASAVALYHGLTPVVTATSGSVGRYYGDGYTRLSLGQFSRLRSDWDLVVQLARENGFDVFVQGTTLFFQPSKSTGAIPRHLAFHDVKTIRFEQTLAIAGNTTARVQSWNSQNMASYDTNSSGGDADTSQASTSASDQPFLFPASNFTSQQVTDSAERYAAELNRLAVVLHAEMPWDLTLSPRAIIFIDETDSTFDTTYQVDSIERHYSTTSGSTQTIRAIIV
jgi:prophage tail gpP-like protein